MEAPTGSRKLLCGVSFLVMFLTGELVVYSLHHETRAKILRGHFVALLQVVFFFISKFIWSSLNLKPRSLSAEPGEANACEDDDLKCWKLWRTTLLVYLILCHSAYLTNYFLMGQDPHWFSMLAYCAIGSYLQLFFALAVLRLINLGVCSTGILLRNPGREKMFSKQAVAFIACFYALVTSSYGIYAATQMPAIKRVTVPIHGLSQAWDSVRIIQISDVHLGPTVGFSKLSAIVDAINGLRADIVVMTGDLVDGPVTVLNSAVAPLANVWSRLGNYFVTGNHEYYTGDVDNWFDWLRLEIKFHPLHNSNVKLTSPDGYKTDTICLAGTDDLDANLLSYTGHGPDYDQALRTCDQDKPVILLAHQPKSAKNALDSPYRVDLALAGHTHGGQFFPMNIGAYFANPFFAGLYKYKDGYVYVSQGTQYFGIPFRLGSTMEITEITLVTAKDETSSSNT